MRSSSQRWVGLGLPLAAAGFAGALCAATLCHAEDTSQWGVYQGAGCTGTERTRQFVSWFGKRPTRGLDFFSRDSWDELQRGAAWIARCWADSGQRQMTFSVPMLTRADAGTLAAGARGDYDGQFRKLAETLVQHGYADAVLRLGWEFNGDWFPWKMQGSPSDFVAYWRRIVTLLRAVPGAAFRFDWSVAAATSKGKAEDAYPGDDYVDIIGLDVYNQSWNPRVITPRQRFAELLRAEYGLRWHKAFAAAHRKSVSFPEWGTGTRADRHGAGDDGYFIEQMARWIATAGPGVAYHCYWDYSAPDYDARLSDCHQPRAAAAFLRVFRGRHIKQACAPGQAP